jgi:hypothetical protein
MVLVKDEVATRSLERRGVCLLFCDILALALAS